MGCKPKAVVGAVVILTLGVAGCATPSRRPPPWTPDAYRAMLVHEYEQLAAQKRPGPFDTDSRTIFRGKAAAARRGQCQEPELLERWRRPERVEVVLRDASGQPKTFNAESLRAYMIGLDLAAQSIPARTQQSRTDVPIARAHLLGRFDCVLAFGRSSEGKEAAQICADEFSAAANYIGATVGSAPPPNQGGKICPQPPKQPTPPAA
jgi:hypothetical protein